MLYTPGRLSDKEMTAIRKQYDYYKITYKNGKVSGLPIFMVRQAEAYERMIPNWDKDMFTKLGMEMDKYFKLMKRIAIAYNNAADVAEQDELKQKFLAMYYRPRCGLRQLLGKHPSLRLQYARTLCSLFPDEGSTE